MIANLVTGIDVGKLRAASALMTAGGLLVSAGLRRVVVGMAGVASGGCEYAVIVHISVYRETAYLGSGRESGDEAHVVDCPVEVGKVAFVAALHHDVDDAAYALGIVFGSRRGDDLYAFDKFGGQAFTIEYRIASHFIFARAKYNKKTDKSVTNQPIPILFQ